MWYYENTYYVNFSNMVSSDIKSKLLDYIRNHNKYGEYISNFTTISNKISVHEQGIYKLNINYK